jgi:hypothetical protein
MILLQKSIQLEDAILSTLGGFFAPIVLLFAYYPVDKITNWTGPDLLGQLLRYIKFFATRGFQLQMIEFGSLFAYSLIVHALAADAYTTG